MSPTSKRVPACDFLYERGRRFTVRVQVPRDVKAALGRGEFKKSSGGDLHLAKRKYHSVVAAFMVQIEAARSGAQPVAVTPGRSKGEPTTDDLDVACYAHFLRMAEKMRGNVAQWVGEKPRELANRAEGFRLMIENQIAAYADDNWSVMAIQATWLCEEHGWTIPSESPLFQHLCQAMLRARLQCYRNELRRLEGKIIRCSYRHPDALKRPVSCA